LKSESPVRAERGVLDLQSRLRSLFLSALFLSAIGFAIVAALTAHPVARASAQSPASPPQVPTQPPGPVNLDALGAKKLPEGPGKQIVETSCKDCHTFDRITSAHHSLARWRVIVREMEQRGADVEPGDVDPLVHYLAQNFGLRHTAAKPASAAPSHPPTP
jgi:cytochrome c5